MTSTKPTPQQVRDYMARRRTSGGPPPSNGEIRQILGWHLLTNNRR